MTIQNPAQNQYSNSWLSQSKGPSPVTNDHCRWSISSDGNAVIIYGAHTATEPDWLYYGPSSNQGALYLKKQSAKNFPSQAVASFHSNAPLQTIASLATRDLVYRTLLLLCPILPSHKQLLLQRGIPNLLEHMNFGSLPDGRGGGRQKIIRELMRRTNLTEQELLQVPGFYRSKKGTIRITGSAGILIPHFDPEGKIEALQVRSTERGKGSRYVWFSASGRGGVPSGAPAGVLWDPETFQGHVVVTEGSFKALALRNVLPAHTAIIYNAGVGQITSALERCIQIEAKSAAVMYDADSLSKPHVMASLSKLVQGLQGLQISTWVGSWPKEQGKGIDDYLVNGHSFEEIKRFEASDVIRAGTKLKQSKHLNALTKAGSQYFPMLPDRLQLFDKKRVIEEAFLRTETQKAIAEALGCSLGELRLVSGPTGSGKTTGLRLFAEKGTIIAFAGYEQLFEFAEELEQKTDKNFGILYGRTGSPQGKDPQQHKRWEAAGCDNYEQASQFSQRLFSACHGCPLRPKGESEHSCQYWKHRRAIESEPPDIILTLASTLFSNQGIGKRLGQNQLDIEGLDDFHTLVLDDINHVEEFLANPIQVTANDLQEWFALIPQELQEIRSALEELNALLFNPERGHELLWEKVEKALKQLQQQEEPLFQPSQDPETPTPLNALPLLFKHLVKRQTLLLKAHESFEFLAPYSKMEALASCRILVLDATPHQRKLAWIAQMLGMRFSMPVLPQRFPKLIQLPEKLWSKAQMGDPLAIAAVEHARREGGLIFGFKDAKDKDGYWGRHERGLNQWAGQDAPFTMLMGHFSMNGEAAARSAWILRQLAQHCQQTIDFPYEKNEGKAKRKYGDAWRPFERKMHQHEDPLAEEIRRHHYTSTVLQMASRSRAFDRPCILFSGEPLELNGELIPVELWSNDELIEHFDLDLPRKKKVLPKALLKLNQQKKEEKQKQVEEAFGLLQKDYTEGLQTPKLSRVKTMLKHKMKECSGNAAKKAWQLWKLHVAQTIHSILQEFIVKNTPIHTQLISSSTVLSDTLVFLGQGSEKTKQLLQGQKSDLAKSEELGPPKVPLPWLLEFTEEPLLDSLQSKNVSLKE